MGSLLDHCVNAIATAAILSVPYGGQVITSPDCFGVKSANYRCHVLTNINAKPGTTDHTPQERVCHARETKISRCTLTHLHLWLQNDMKGRLLLLTSSRSDRLVRAGSWHSAPCVLSSFVLLVWKTRLSNCSLVSANFMSHTGWTKLCKKLNLELLSQVLVTSNNSWWCYFFNLSDLIANRGQWYFQVCQSHSTLWKLWKPLELWVLALTSEKQPSCDKCLLRMLLITAG